MKKVSVFGNPSINNRAQNAHAGKIEDLSRKNAEIRNGKRLSKR